MIISASRRTDIPNYFSDWFIKRIEARSVLVRNPFRIHDVYEIDLSTDVVDCIVLWTKNPAPMMPYLNRLESYPYYFQFTLNAYDTSVEPHVPNKSKRIIDTFKRLSETIGAHRVIWRYDPILISKQYDLTHHLKYFEVIARQLSGYTEICKISFLDIYSSKRGSFRRQNLRRPNWTEQTILIKTFSEILNAYNIKAETCAEEGDFSQYGVEHGSCISEKLISRLIAEPIEIKKDKNQRNHCGCLPSLDIGVYNTCLNGCVYCYANHSRKQIESSNKLYDSDSPLLCSKLSEGDLVKKRETSSIRKNQLSFPI